jgi:LemA protein
VSEARSKLAGAATVADIAQADAEVTSALSRLLAIVENYPELKANENFIQLQDELAGTENRIAVARRDYNEAARSYNTSIRRFPTNIIAGMFGFERAQYFEASEDARQAPDVGDLFGD